MEWSEKQRLISQETNDSSGRYIESNDNDTENIDVTLTPEQRRIRQLARDFTAKYIIPVAGKYDETGEIPEFIAAEAVKVGLFGPAIPKGYGGPGYDLLTEALIAEEIGYGCGGFANILCGSMTSVNLVRLAGTEEQKKLYFGRIVSGGMPGFVLSEPGAGSDAGSVATTARLEGNEWVLNGAKCFASFCGYNSIMIVFASTAQGKDVKDKKGLSAFIVEREREGLTVGAVEHKLGLRASNSVELLLRNVRVPKNHLIGREGEGFKYAMRILDIGRVIAGATATGIARRALDEAIKYCLEYIDVSGKRLAEHQSVAFKLADMAIQVEAARQFVYSITYLDKAGVVYTKEASMVKTFCTDMAMRVCADVVGLLGSYGYSRDSVVEKLMRDVKIFQIFEGTNQIQRLVISRQLLDKRFGSKR